MLSSRSVRAHTTPRRQWRGKKRYQQSCRHWLWCVDCRLWLGSRCFYNMFRQVAPQLFLGLEKNSHFSRFFSCVCHNSGGPVCATNRAHFRTSFLLSVLIFFPSVPPGPPDQTDRFARRRWWSSWANSLENLFFAASYSCRADKRDRRVVFCLNKMRRT